MGCFDWPRGSVCAFAERPLHPREKLLEQVLEWSGLDEPGSAFLVVRKHPDDKMAADGTGSDFCRAS